MGKDSVPNFIIKRRNRYYFRSRVPADAIDPLGKEVVVSLQTTDKDLARDRMPNVLNTFRNCVKNANLIDRAEFINRLRDSVMGEVQPIPEYDGLRKSIQFLVLFSFPEFRNLWEANAKQARMLCKVRSMLNAGQPASPFTLKDPDAIARLVQEGDLRARQAFADHGYDFDDFPPTSPQEKPWQDYLEEFWKDNPGYAAKSITGMKTTFSYLERVWKKKPLNRINKGDLVDVANFLRDFVSERSNQPLSYKTIQRQLGEVKTFLRWAISKAYLHDDGFELVKPRKQTLDEKRSRDKRRSFTLEELKYFFNSSTFSDRETGPRWWLAIILAMTGARGGEIIKAPSELVMVGSVPCIDLREAGTKTANASRLIPVIDELKELGFLEYAAEQKRKNLPLIHAASCKGGIRSEGAFLTALNRTIRTVFPDDLDLISYSFRHHFRQMLSASNIGLELSNKVFGHRGGETYERYGKGLSEAEAATFVEKVHFPFSLKFLVK